MPRRRTAPRTRGSRRLRVEDAVSCGGIVYRRLDQGIEFALCGRRTNHIWALPKGTPLPGETVEQTAVREVEEETGLEVRIEGRIGEIEYWFSRVEQGVRIHKVVHHYLMTAVGGDMSRHDHEYDEVRWFTIGEAEAALSYANEVEILRRAVTLLEAGAVEHTASRAVENGGRGPGS